MVKEKLENLFDWLIYYLLLPIKDKNISFQHDSSIKINAAEHSFYFYLFVSFVMFKTVVRNYFNIICSLYKKAFVSWSGCQT